MSLRRRARFVGFTAIGGLGLLGGIATSAQAATDTLYAAPASAGADDCSSLANACSLSTAITNANAAPITDDVVIKLAGGTYSLGAPATTAFPITFTGPSLTLEADSGTPTLDGGRAMRLLSIAAGANVMIDGLAIESGVTSGLGGGIDNGGRLTVERSTFSGNSASSGGAIANESGAALTVKDSSFSDNTTTSVGGGAIVNFGAATVERSAIVDNTAPINGGGINVQSAGTLTVDSSTIAGNTSGSLGGGLSNLGTLTVQSSTIMGNSGSGGAAIATGNANVTLAADIIAAQTSGGACSPANASMTDAGYNLDSDGTCISPTSPAAGSHNGTTAYGSSTYAAALDAYLADALGDNGGPTQTIALLNSPDPSTTLANPAFDVIPPSFDLPTAVDGVSAACSTPDQRGVVPVAGANCAIGAYLLQATATALSASAPSVVQNSQVTWTATITPAANGGTVAFDDGAGNPATTQCAAQPVSSGTATCTVSYANTGSYSARASYTGDGASNNFVGSATTGQTTVVVAPPPVDPTPPPSTLRPFALKLLSSGPSCISSSASGSNKLTARLQLSEAASVKLTLQRRVEQPRRPVYTCPKAKPGPGANGPLPGYRNVTRPATPPKGKKASAAAVPKVVSASLSAGAGVDTVALLKAVHAGALAPGRYRVVIDATRGADEGHATAYVFFRILNPRPKPRRHTHPQRRSKHQLVA